MKTLLAFPTLFLTITAVAQKPATDLAHNRVQTATGQLAGSTAASGIHTFKGIPYAAPPVGPRRWQAPQPAPKWTNVRPATQFGPRAMQLPLFGDMNFRSNGVSEDCLYLNVWTGA
ncbi:MAG: carboxylesterase family protein, partial [Hymenobacter sp.]